MRYLSRLVALAFLVLLLAGCGGGGSSSSSATTSTKSVHGSGVKGPLAGAVVRIYKVDLTKSDLKGDLLEEGSTGSDAAIEDLDIEEGLSGLLLLEFVVDDDTVEINTGETPVLDRLVTVVDVQRIYDGGAVYASPLTTMAVSLAQRKADGGAPYNGNGDLTISVAEFTAALALAQGQVKSTLGFGLDSTIDIFNVPPLLTDETDDAEQEQVVRYRQAIEALAALALQVADDSSADDTPQQIFDALIEDLTDGQIDGQNSGTPIPVLASLDTPIDAILAGLDLSTLIIPGTTTPVSDIEEQLAAEVVQTGAAVDTTDLESGAIAADLDPPVLVADSATTASMTTPMPFPSMPPKQRILMVMESVTTAMPSPTTRPNGSIPTMTAWVTTVMHFRTIPPKQSIRMATPSVIMQIPMTITMACSMSVMLSHWMLLSPSIRMAMAWVITVILILIPQ